METDKGTDSLGGEIPQVTLKETEIGEEQEPKKYNKCKNTKVIIAAVGVAVALVVTGAVVGGLAGSGKLSSSSASKSSNVEEFETVDEGQPEISSNEPYVRYEMSPRNYFTLKDGPLFYADATNEDLRIKPNGQYYNSSTFEEKYVHKNRGPEPMRKPTPKVVYKSYTQGGDMSMKYDGMYFSRPTISIWEVAPQKEILTSLWNWEEWDSKRGDGICGKGEWYRNSPDDCPGFFDCGNGLCDEGELHSTCPEDCMMKQDVCGDGYMPPDRESYGPYEIHMENPYACPIDASADQKDVCGDGVCGITESCFFCSEDCNVCPPKCGDGKCSVGIESCDSCPRDCGQCEPVEGDDVCAFPYETPENSRDCAPVYLSNQIEFEGTRYSTIDNAAVAGWGDNKTCEEGKVIPRGWRISRWEGEGSRVDRLRKKYRFATTCLAFEDGTAKATFENKDEWCTTVDLQLVEDKTGLVIPKYTRKWYCPGHRVLIEAIADTYKSATKTCPENCFGNGECDTYTGQCKCKSRWTGFACQRVIGDLSIPKSDNDWWKPDRYVTWQWHLDGVNEMDPSEFYDVDVYDVDLETTPAVITTLHNQGKKVLCYFSAGSWELFRSDEALLDKSIRGGPLIFGEGDVFLDEAWLDLKRPDMIMETMLNRVEKAKRIGCDGIEFDNPDIAVHYITFPDGSMVDLTTNFYFNIWLIRQTHARGMAVALKNSDFFAAFLADEYDMVVNEECHVNGICDSYWPFLNRNKPVLNAEYLGARCFYCEKANRMGLSTIKKKPPLDHCMVDCRTEWSDKLCAGYGYPENLNKFPQTPNGWCPFMMNQDVAECNQNRYSEWCYGARSY